MPKGIYGKVGESGVIHDPSRAVIQEQNLIAMKGLPEDCNAVAQEDGSWVVTEEVTQALYEAELAGLDPLLSHVLRHELNGDAERAGRAEHELLLAQAKILEKYGKGSTVYVTASGSCYHASADCSALSNSTDILEIKESDGLENYTPCSICCN